MKYTIFFIFIVICSVVGCQNNTTKELLINDSKLLTVGLLNVIKAKEYDKMKQFYSTDFYSNINEGQWIDDMQKIDSKLGNIESYELSETLVNSENGVISVTLTYIVRRKNHLTTEKFQVSVIGNNARIRAHNIKI